MKKLFLIPALFALGFSQNGNNQIPYTIYTLAKSYNNVTLHSVDGGGLVINEKNGMKKFTIPITIINGIRMKERGFGVVGRAFCTGLGAFGGTIISLISTGLPMSSPYRNSSALDTAMAWGSVAIGAWIGNKVGNSLFRGQTQLVSFKDKSLNEKIHYLKSLTNQ